MWDNRKHYNGLSILPFDGGTYVQAPFTDCSKEEYDELLPVLKDINLDNVVESEDNTDLTGEVACAGGKCDLEF
jgi:ribonucleoside-triphosphate reductase (thioredoxin)